MDLQIHSGGFSYGKHRILKNINLSLASNTILAILGPNGAGKTTLLRCIMNLLRWEEGCATLNGKKIDTFDVKDLWRHIAYVPQARQGSDSTVRNTIVLGRSAHIPLLGKPSSKDYEIADSVMERLGILNLADRVCSNLSGGELQLVLIGRALATRPQVLVLDEPESNLDYYNQIHVLELIKEISKTAACVLNTHYPEHALRFADQSLLLFGDGTHIYGNTKDVLTEKNLKRAFNVEVHIGENILEGKRYEYIIPLHVQ